MTSPRPLLLILLSVGVFDGLARVAFCGCVPDSDADGVCDDLDLCPATIPGADVDTDGCPRKAPADFDFDGDVDLEDLNVMRTCLNGPGASIVDAPECEDADFDFDQDVDLGDIGVFAGCFGGADVPSDTNCVSPRVEIVDGCLTIIDTAASTAITLRLEPGDPATLQIDFGDDGTADFLAQRPLFDCIHVFARGGDDVVRIDDSNGVFTIGESTTLDGGSGDDLLLGGNGPESLMGGTGNDLIDGNQVADTAVLGGDDDNDTLSGGAGADQLFGGPGSDLLIWNPGDDSDLMEGGDGVDTVEVNGHDQSEQFTITANGMRVRFDGISPTPFTLDIGDCESVRLNARGGDDLLSCSGNLGPLTQITADGGEGDDTLLGGNGADVLIGGDGDDIIDGNQGGDVAILGAGNDFFQWDPGDGSDTIDGQADHDLLLFNGSNVAENFVFSIDGTNLRLTRDVALVTMDAAGIEQVILLVAGGADNITVNNLRETDVEEIDISLEVLGATFGDGQADTVSVNGASDADDLTITSGSEGILIVDPSTLINITAVEPSLDRLMVNGLGGNDRIQAGDLGVGRIALTINGGAGNDTLQGSDGPDLLLGDEDNDTIIGGVGEDQMSGGAGNDRFIWNPGDDDDLMEGGDGVDRVEVNGSEEAEIFSVTADGTRVRFDRTDPTPFALDIGACEALVIYARGGNDSLVCTGNLVALIQITADGGPGEDTLLGGNGADL